jgi:uncharacterized repeat protein (TIGR02543 family)
VYKYTKAVADAAALNGIISAAEPAGTGTGTADNETLEISLKTPKGADFTSNGKFLVVLTSTDDDSAPLKYKAAVPFSGGSATVEYDDMETATRLYTVTFDLNYTGATNSPDNQKIDEVGKVTIPTPPTRTGYTFGGWFTDAAGTGAAWDFDKDTVTEDITLYAKWMPLTFAVLLADMAANAAASTEKTYTLPSGSETYILAITPLTTSTSPASVVIDGGGRVVTGSTNRITIGADLTITLKNITFKTLPFTVSGGRETRAG